MRQLIQYLMLLPGKYGRLYTVPRTHFNTAIMTMKLINELQDMRNMIDDWCKQDGIETSHSDDTYRELNRGGKKYGGTLGRARQVAAGVCA